MTRPALSLAAVVVALLLLSGACESDPGADRATFSAWYIGTATAAALEGRPISYPDARATLCEWYQGDATADALRARCYGTPDLGPDAEAARATGRAEAKATGPAALATFCAWYHGDATADALRARCLGAP